MPNSLIDARELRRQLKLIQGAFKGVPRRATQRLLKRVMGGEAEELANRARANAPVRLGRLRANIRAAFYSITPGKDFVANAYVNSFGMRDKWRGGKKVISGVGAYYGLWVEQGHRIVPPGGGLAGKGFAQEVRLRMQSRGRTRANPFMKRAWESQKASVSNAIVNEIPKGVINIITRRLKKLQRQNVSLSAGQAALSRKLNINL